ncbi:PTS sugar transporter subunit IIB [Caldibacillus thermoamylovorans]|uniref:PTS sugar transporter subunit IIB n=1 Tax=Bacillaceae TaxID=186817 RepID=UPI001D096A50|nr:PTS sugar transporter subunit IIB [Caldibacillus thermoamylovorans]MCB5936421.1 PTS sugar transporter subunit IIB [Bacillus sp. DFI.2.34]MCB7078181.1 PTS sugar transporter subunit IIB [Caldibacillus thermoamylovorans]
MIKLVRIDYRLLHGQVVFAWINRLGIDRIVIIDDEASKDEMKKTSLKLTKPQNVKLNIFSVQDALDRKNKIKALKENTMIIFSNTRNCYEFLSNFAGVVKEVNYGGIPNKEGAKQFDKAIFLNEEEIEESKKLRDLGLRLYSQQTPTTKVVELNNKL